jgi:hypothetical protein
MSGSNLNQAMKQEARCKEKLIVLLDKEKSNLFPKLVNVQNESNTTLAEKNLIFGFRLGMRLVIESMVDNGWEPDRYRKNW